MLNIRIPAREYFDEEKSEFLNIESFDLSLEHSLASISRWESKWHIPFLDDTRQKTEEQTLDYIRCMILSPKVTIDQIKTFPTSVFQIINKYVENPMSATWFKDEKKKSSKEIITAEIIYYWMFSLNIPLECEQWHFNRLMTLIRVASIKNSPDKKMSRREILNSNAALNAQRRAKYNTTG